MTQGWRDLEGRTRRSLPPRIRDWLALETSMTARVGEAAGGPVDVEVLRQGAGRLLPDERRFFPGSVGPATVREVCLSSEGLPLLVARTVLTSRRLQEHPTIRNLGTRALGSLLFADGSPLWTDRQVARLTSDAPLFRLVRRRHLGVAPAYWARRTLYRLFGEPLLVTEIVLPELIHRTVDRAGPALVRALRVG